MKKILFIEDQENYLKAVTGLLEMEGYEVDAVTNPVEGFDKFKENEYNLVITDLIMDTIDGLQLVSLIKRSKSHIPIIVLTGHEDIGREIEGLDLDVDDYIYKSTSFEVLIKRINKCLRIKRTDNIKSELYSNRENIKLDVPGRKVYQNSELIQLTFREFELLAFFLRNKNVVLSRDEIIENVWHVGDGIIDQRTVDTHVKNLRIKMNLNSISTIRGVGYEWFE